MSGLEISHNIAVNLSDLFSESSSPSENKLLYGLIDTNENKSRRCHPVFANLSIIRDNSSNEISEHPGSRLPIDWRYLNSELSSDESDSIYENQSGKKNPYISKSIADQLVVHDCTEKSSISPKLDYNRENKTENLSLVTEYDSNCKLSTFNLYSSYNVSSSRSSTICSMNSTKNITSPEQHIYFASEPAPVLGCDLWPEGFSRPRDSNHPYTGSTEVVTLPTDGTTTGIVVKQSTGLILAIRQGTEMTPDDESIEPFPVLVSEDTGTGTVVYNPCHITKLQTSIIPNTAIASHVNVECENVDELVTAIEAGELHISWSLVPKSATPDEHRKEWPGEDYTYIGPKLAKQWRAKALLYSLLNVIDLNSYSNDSSESTEWAKSASKSLFEFLQNTLELCPNKEPHKRPQCDSPISKRCALDNEEDNSVAKNT